ncbi:thermolysin metallopeptidase-like protein [Homoserinimonas aerilata]|uniref:Neutral metalloproteinase n=1 Tax=Homoserinimonas aerilata TaxID=1162970 RepID=A0A542YK27_9MICO|nr:M4 family metallopeptidase [Homoserinimonas aerilata]TQL48420.1 thermolysin metallopeptidase-like protein [Homoserinimonas aerilata]
MRCAIVPPYLLARIAQAGDSRFGAAAEAARRSLLHDDPLRAVRCEQLREGIRQAPDAPATVTRDARPHRVVFDAGNLTELPGREVRAEASDPVDDVTVNEAYDGLGSCHRFFSDALGRLSVDGRNMPLHGTVHYGRDYDNAFWDGSRMVFGDGDGEVFGRFTASLSVIGHELAHGVTQHTAGLIYEGQSGALNESISDVFGALVEQFTLGQQADAASWLIGEGLFTEEVQGRALRSMLEPGTAYDDDVIGRDPQPAHMDGYIATRDDNGGVHLNSGIPNRAFALAALALGGNAWERAGTIWYATLTGGLPSRTDFVGFASATAQAARTLHGDDSAEHRAVVEGWRSVGVDFG